MELIAERDGGVFHLDQPLASAYLDDCPPQPPNDLICGIRGVFFPPTTAAYLAGVAFPDSTRTYRWERVFIPRFGTELERGKNVTFSYKLEYNFPAPARGTSRLCQSDRALASPSQRPSKYLT